ncbi:MAG: hypothetical protein OHK0013_46990 [Sandaracinaceae bacterium]
MRWGLAVMVSMAFAGCADRGFWWHCTGRVPFGARTRTERGEIWCYCPEGWICHEDRFYPDVSYPDASIDAVAREVGIDGAHLDAETDATRLDAEIHETVLDAEVDDADVLDVDAEDGRAADAMSDGAS